MRDEEYYDGEEDHDHDDGGGSGAGGSGIAGGGRDEFLSEI